MIQRNRAGEHPLPDLYDLSVCRSFRGFRSDSITPNPLHLTESASNPRKDQLPTGCQPVSYSWKITRRTFSALMERSPSGSLMTLFGVPIYQLILL